VKKEKKLIITPKEIWNEITQERFDTSLSLNKTIEKFKLSLPRIESRVTMHGFQHK